MRLAELSTRSLLPVHQAAVEHLTRLYRKTFGEVVTVGVGNGWNDVKFLAAVDVPVLVRSRYDIAIQKALPHCLMTQAPGPYGWNTALMELLAA